jgi:hypothetical protein
MSVDLKIQQLQATQYVHELPPTTLLPPALCAVLLGRSASSVGSDVTRNPSSLPDITRIGGKVFFLKSDVDAFIQECRNSTPSAPKRRLKKKGGAA